MVHLVGLVRVSCARRLVQRKVLNVLRKTWNTKAGTSLREISEHRFRVTRISSGMSWLSPLELDPVTLLAAEGVAQGDVCMLSTCKVNRTSFTGMPKDALSGHDTDSGSES